MLNCKFYVNLKSRLQNVTGTAALEFFAGTGADSEAELFRL